MSEENNDGDRGEGPKHQFASIDPAVAKATASEIGASHTFSPDNIRERLDEGEHDVALILTSTLLEKILSLGIREHYGWDQGKFETKGFDKFSLGTYLEECTEYGVFKDYTDDLNKMRSGENEIMDLRNNLVHEHGYMESLERNEDLQQDAEEAIEEAIDFIESVEI